MNAYGGILVVAIVCLSLTWFPLGTLAYEPTFEVPYKVRRASPPPINCEEDADITRLIPKDGPPEYEYRSLRVVWKTICVLHATAHGLECDDNPMPLNLSQRLLPWAIAIVRTSKTSAELMYFTIGYWHWPPNTVAAIRGPEVKLNALSLSKRIYSSSISIKDPGHPERKITFENGKTFLGPLCNLPVLYHIPHVKVEKKDSGEVTRSRTVEIVGRQWVSDEIDVYTAKLDGMNVNVLPSKTDLEKITKQTNGIALVLKDNGEPTLKLVKKLNFPLTGINNVLAIILLDEWYNVTTDWRKRSAVFHFRDYELTFPLKKKITNITFSPKDLDQDAFLRLKRLHPIRYNQDQAKLLRQWVYPKPRESDADYANRLVKSWKRAGIEVVAFGFDGTLIACNNYRNGSLVGGLISDIKLTDHAEKLIQACWDNKVGVWIASNHDNLDEHHVRLNTYAEPPPSRTPFKLGIYSDATGRTVIANCYWPTNVTKPRSTRSMYGAYLISGALTTSNLEFDDKHPINIVTFLPDERRTGSGVYNPPGTEFRPKIIHLQQIARIAEFNNGKVMLIDDSLENVESAVKYGFVGAHVSGGNGIMLDSLTAVSP